MMYNYGMLLSLSVKSRICLLILFKAPCKPEPHNYMTPVLQIQSVPRSRRMSQKQRDLSCVPFCDILGAFKFFCVFKPFQYSLAVVPIAVKAKYRLSL